MTLVAYGMVLVFMMVAGMNSKATFQSLIAAFAVISQPKYFVGKGGAINEYGYGLLAFWLASILVTKMRSA